MTREAVTQKINDGYEKAVREAKERIRLARLLRRTFGSEVREVTVKMRDCQDVPKFLKKLDVIQKRTAKSKLHFGTVKEGL